MNDFPVLENTSVDEALKLMTTNDLILWSLALVANSSLTVDDVESACEFAVSGAPISGIVKEEHMDLLRKKLRSVYSQLIHEFNT